MAAERGGNEQNANVLSVLLVFEKGEKRQGRRKDSEGRRLMKTAP